LRRGEIWTVADSGDYTGKPRPIVIIQDERFDATDSICVCALTTTQADAPLVRIGVTPSADNGLRARSWIMADKVTTMRRSRLGRRVGHLDRGTIRHLNRALFLFLGLGQASP
jgi:mRNA interferase MazF